MTDNAVAMKKALPSPHTARSPISCSMLPATPHARVASTIRESPTRTVRLAPNRALDALVTSIARTWIPR